MDLHHELRILINQTLNLNGRLQGMVLSTPLLDAVPELDSMGVVALIAGLEEHFDISVDDGDIDGSVFQTFGSLLAFVQGKLASG